METWYFANLEDIQFEVLISIFLSGLFCVVPNLRAERPLLSMKVRDSSEHRNYIRCSKILMFLNRRSWHSSIHRESREGTHVIGKRERKHAYQQRDLISHNLRDVCKKVKGRKTKIQ